MMLNLFFHRFKEDKGEIAALRTKEQGDWKKLTTEEKKVQKLHITYFAYMYTDIVWCLSLQSVVKIKT